TDAARQPVSDGRPRRLAGGSRLPGTAGFGMARRARSRGDSPALRPAELGGATGGRRLTRAATARSLAGTVGSATPQRGHAGGAGAGVRLGPHLEAAARRGTGGRTVTGYLDRYGRSRSVCHALPPRVKLLLALGTIVLAVSIPPENWPLLGLVACVVFAGQ